MRQSETTVTIEGILSENRIELGSYDKDGRKVECIRGNIVVKTEEVIGEDTVTLEIPVYVFANKTYMSKKTNREETNPAYTSLLNVMNTFKSIAAVGEEEADRVRIFARDAIRMNEYWRDEQTLSSQIRINASYINKVDKSKYKPQATFSTDLFIKKIIPEFDKEGIETGRIKLECCLVGYNDRVDVVPFYSMDEKVTSAIENQWSVHDTVKATGVINFSSVTTITKEARAFGKPIETPHTTYVNELLINGGSEALGDGLRYEVTDIRDSLKAREVRLEAMKNRKKAGAVTKAAPAKEKTDDILDDLGF